MKSILLVVAVLSLTGCAAMQTAETQVITTARQAEDMNIAGWRTNACATPLSAIVRNAQQVPGLVGALTVLCIPNADDNVGQTLNGIPHK